MFEMPAYQNLSKEQDSVINLPLEGISLITGPPGTGKTVVALYRAELCQKAGMSPRLIVFNNTLDQYLNLATNHIGVSANTSTFHSWFGSWYNENFGRYAPKVDDYVFDWDQIFINIGHKGNDINKEKYIILDEGQDFPPRLYMILPLIMENISVYADENQRLREHNSTINEIRKNLGLIKTYPLTRNYRNSRPIAEFAKEFYSGLASGIPILPERTGDRPRVITGTPYRQQIKNIITYAQNNPKKQIGVFVWDRKTQWSIYAGITDNSDLPVQMYRPNGREFLTIDFTKNGIFLFCFASTKGLEFDTVYLPQLQKIRTDADSDDLKMKMYVLTSRARDELILMTGDQEVPGFMEHVPDNLFNRL